MTAYYDTCFLRQFSEKRCHGEIIRAHLIEKQVLKRRKLDHLIDDPRTFVPACGGYQGVSGHHGMLDAYRLIVPRDQLPAGLEELAAEYDLEWWLDRRYGPKEQAA